ncbi:MAG: YpdA family putative bacillithiol disulfide reductase [Acidobacteria bacterium]|nr:YpdA family putative bacillithiol disulfide reductase [Acidobacteriota bacterium]
MSEVFEVIVIGGGPAGLACGIEARRRHLKSLVIEKGCLVNSIYHFPVGMTFFTTADLLEIGDIPLVCSSEKPKRSDVLKYYRRVVEQYQLNVRDYERVISISGTNGNFAVQTVDRNQVHRTYQTRKLIVAIGYYDHPNMLNIPGEDLPKVSHYYVESHPYFRKKVAVIGGKNSAAEAALELYRNGAEVTLIHRRESMDRDVKYWVLPDINNRINRREIEALFSSYVTEIRQEEIVVCTPSGLRILENDFVLALTGYHPDKEFLESMGIQVDPVTYAPVHNPQTLESNVAGIYVAGSVVSGKMTNRIFIENGRFHGTQIFQSLEISSLTV